MRCSKNATISKGPNRADSAIDPFRTHLKNRILVQDRGGAELFQDNWIPHRFYYIKGRRPRCGIPRLIELSLWVANRRSA